MKKHYFTKSAGAKCDHFKLGVRTRVRACDPRKGRNSHLGLNGKLFHTPVDT